MSNRVTQSMDWLHTWAGLLFGWLLFAIFLTGTLTVFDHELTYWMRPELHRLTPAAPNLDTAAARLAALAPDAKEWAIILPFARNPALIIAWDGEGESEHGEQGLDPATGQPIVVRDTMGGEFFYRFHYRLHLGRPGVWIVGAAAMAMLVALVSGIVIHRRIFKDFFTFRPWASAHRAWLDAHNAASVLVLPFHFMITFTGLVIFWMTYMPAALHLFYEGSAEQAYAALEQHIQRAPAGSPAPLRSLQELERQARGYWNGGVTEWIAVTHPGDRRAIVEIVRRANDRLALISDRVTFDGVTGDLLQVWRGDRPVFTTYAVLLGLHFLWFDHATIRWLYFAMGLAASGMIATGLLLWVVKRREHHVARHRGYRLVESLNVAVVAGLPAAVAVLFWSNRLLPVDLVDRMRWEIRLFFLAWSLCALHAALRPNGRRLWCEQLSAAAVLFASVPVVNGLTSSSHLLVTMPARDWTLAGVDLTCLAAGIAFAWTAGRISRQMSRESQPKLGALPASEDA